MKRKEKMEKRKEIGLRKGMKEEEEEKNRKMEIERIIDGRIEIEIMRRER